MLKDRRALIEVEINKQKAVCGSLYLAMIKAGLTSDAEYDQALEKLSRMMTEQMIINDMIAAGHP